MTLILTKHGIGVDHGVVTRNRKEFRYIEYTDGSRYVPLELFATETVEASDKTMTRMYAVKTWAAIKAGKMRMYSEDLARKAEVLKVLK